MGNRTGIVGRRGEQEINGKQDRYNSREERKQEINGKQDRYSWKERKQEINGKQDRYSWEKRKTGQV